MPHAPCIISPTLRAMTDLAPTTSFPHAQLSPYLNVNPSYVQTPEFIVNQEQKKGRIEQSFAGIGASVIVGAAAGGAYGFYDGSRQTAAAGMTGTLKRTQIMNYTMKSGTPCPCSCYVHVKLSQSDIHSQKLRQVFIFSPGSRKWEGRELK